MDSPIDCHHFPLVESNSHRVVSSQIADWLLVLEELLGGIRTVNRMWNK